MLFDEYTMYSVERKQASHISANLQQSLGILDSHGTEGGWRPESHAYFSLPLVLPPSSPKADALFQPPSDLPGEQKFGIGPSVSSAAAMYPILEGFTLP